MFFLALGVAVGLAVAFGPLSFLHSSIDGLINALVSTSEHALVSWLGQVPYLSHETKLVTTLSVLIAVTAPGLVAMGLILLARASIKARRAMSALVLVAGLAGLFFLPASESVPLLLGALVIGSVASVLSGAAVTAPLSGLATVIVIRFGLDIWHGRSGAAAGADTLAKLTGTGSPNLWALALTVTGLAPLAAAALTVFKSHHVGR